MKTFDEWMATKALTKEEVKTEPMMTAEMAYACGAAEAVEHAIKHGVVSAKDKARSVAVQAMSKVVTRIRDLVAKEGGEA